jgi:hypothetical protein
MIEAPHAPGTIPSPVPGNNSTFPAAPEETPPAPGKPARTQGSPGRRRHPAGKALFLLVAACLLGSCISIPRAASDDDVCYAPSMGGYDYFWYFSTADPGLPLKSKRAEIIRLERFRKWLTRNGYESPAFEVVSRRVERSEKILGMTVYEIKYLIKVKQPTGTEEKSNTTGPAEKTEQPTDGKDKDKTTGPAEKVEQPAGAEQSDSAPE